MNQYRKEASVVAKETSWTFFRFLPILLLIMVIIGGVGFGLRSLGLVGGTIVEREVFENSFQYSEARKTEILTYRAQLTEIENLLSNEGIDEKTRQGLEAQAANIRIQISVASSR